VFLLRPLQMFLMAAPFPQLVLAWAVG